jgi:hypothetical protein
LRWLYDQPLELRKVANIVIPASKLFDYLQLRCLVVMIRVWGGNLLFTFGLFVNETCPVILITGLFWGYFIEGWD